MNNLPDWQKKIPLLVRLSLASLSDNEIIGGVVRLSENVTQELILTLTKDSSCVVVSQIGTIISVRLEKRDLQKFMENEFVKRFEMPQFFHEY